MALPNINNPASPKNSTKGNNGRGGRKRLVCKLLIWLALILGSYQMLWSYYLAGINIPDVEIDKVTGQKRVRRRPDQLVKRDHVAGIDVPTSPFDGIMEGYYTLVDIQLPKEGLVATADGKQKYGGVQGRFCMINWNLQKDDPSKVPMFKDLEDQSMMCDSTMYSVDLWDITRKASDYDNRNQTFASTMPRPGQGPVKPTAVVFHETRCGSTLIANVLAAFSPDRSRVYSESPPPVAALSACDRGRPCDDGAQTALIQDVFYMMGRALEHNMRKFVFYKIQSVGVKYIDAFTKAMPETPWVFAYRDSVEVMMSHFKNYQQGNPLSKHFTAVCTRNFGKSRQPALLTEIVESKGRTVRSLSPEEYCAAHLATLAESAIREYERTTDPSQPAVHQHHWFVNYKELPYKIWESVLPELVGPVREHQIESMLHVSKSYSKGRGPKANEHFHEDATVKQSKAPPSVKEAVKLFLDPSYLKMESIRMSMEPKH